MESDNIDPDVIKTAIFNLLKLTLMLYSKYNLTTKNFALSP